MVLIASFWGVAHAGPASTGDAMDRFEEVLEMRIDEGLLSRDEVLPAIIVSVTPRYEVSEGWFAVRAIEVLNRSFGEGGLRLCEACMAPRAWVQEGSLAYQTGPISLEEVARLDEQTRGTAAAARSAIWIDETRSGVSAKFVDLRTGRILFAQNFDPMLIENKNSARMSTLSEELERRARGDSLTQAFVDLALYPGQHVSLDFTDQWGKTNANMTGVTLSAFDPVIGLGLNHYRRFDLLNVLVGAKVIVSLPTAVARAFSTDDVELLDPTLTAVGVVRVPLGRSNYGALVTASTNGEFGLGLSLLNIRLLPVIP